MLGVFAEFETNLRRERQLEGIQAAKANGVYTELPIHIFNKHLILHAKRRFCLIYVGM